MMVDPAQYILNSAVDPANREKLAQYFVNNFRETNPEKLSEFLMNATNDYTTGILLGGDKNRSFNCGPLNEPNNVNFLRNSSNFGNISGGCGVVAGAVNLSSGDDQLYGGGGGDHNPQQLHLNSSMLDIGDKDVDLESNESCSDDLSLTLSPGGKNRGETLK